MTMSSHSKQGIVIASLFENIRNRTEQLCTPLSTEDYVVQPIADVSPPKWHLGHTTWFFETFILKPNIQRYVEFNPHFNFVFNSYYESVGARSLRTDRGNLSRPKVEDVYAYREYVDKAMLDHIMNGLTEQQLKLLEIGLNHEQQHQELLLTDIKFILGHNPLQPAYNEQFLDNIIETSNSLIEINEGVYEIGHLGDSFAFDNELGRHKVYLNSFQISNKLITNIEYLEFINAGGYKDFRFWHADGWDWVKRTNSNAPMYWHYENEQWLIYDLYGLKPLIPTQAVAHVNYYEAYAYAAWKGMRLPSEFEWEIASSQFSWGNRWEWTESAYLPYPGFIKSEGAIGEYNGKFMVGQQILRGASDYTPAGHSRPTYRNFFKPESQWQLTGIRLAK